jgi:hypothetical protein
MSVATKKTKTVTMDEAFTAAYNKIPAKAMELFLEDKLTLGQANDVFKVDQTKVGISCFRVNVWTRHTKEGRVVPTFNIVASYFLQLTDSGEIVDRTI